MSDFYAQKAHDLRQAGANDTQNLERMLDSSGKLASVELAATKGKPDAYGQLAGRLKEQYGTGMNHGWQGVMQTALEAASGSKKRAELESLQQKMQQMQDYANHAANANDVAMKNKAAGEAVKPILDAYLTNSDKMAPEQRLESLKSALNTYNNIAKTDYELFSVDAQNPAKVTLSSKTKGFQGLDMLNSPIFAEINRQKQIQDIEKKAEDFQRDKLKLGQDTLSNDVRRVDAYKQQVANSEEAQVIKRMGAAEKTHEASAALKDLIGVADSVDEILSKKGNEDLLASLTGNVWRANDPGFFTQNARKAIGNPGQQEDASRLNKLFNQLKAMNIKGMPAKGLNQYVEKILASSTPNEMMHQGAALTEIRNLRHRAEASLEAKQELLAAYGDIRGAEYAKNQISEIPKKAQDATPQTIVTDKSGNVKMKGPETGKEEFVPANKVEDAKKKGFVVVHMPSVDG
jgi:hypothetical protein